MGCFRACVTWTRHRLAAGAAALVALGLTIAPAAAELEKRVALVVGNGAYKTAPHLDNPVNDAKGVSAALKRLGFSVVEGYDLGTAEMHARIGEFSAALPDAKAALVYYAGHGVSVDEDNFLLPTDIVLKGPADLDLNAVNLSLLLKLMKRQETINVVILDACRDNPFAAELARLSKNRSADAERGLSRIDSDLAKGTLIAFATDPKSTALDGMPGANSPFTKALLAHIEDPGVPIGTVMDRVRAEVYEATMKRQTPWVNTSLIGEFILNPVVAAKSAPVEVASLTPQTAPATTTLSNERLSLDDKLWTSAEKSNTAEDYKAYLEALPSGAYAQMAKNRIVRLNGAPALARDANTAALDALKGETGTAQSEAALKLDAKVRQELEARLQALGFDPGDADGNFNAKTRAAIADWQKGHETPATTWLGPLQYAALLRESEASFLKMRAAQASSPVVRKMPPKAQPVAMAPPPRKRRRYAPDAGGTDYSGGQPAAAYPNPGASQAGAFLGGMLLGGAMGGFGRYH